MKRILLSLAFVGLSISMAQAETIRLIVSDNNTTTQSKSTTSQQSSMSPNGHCIITPNGEGEWCIPSIVTGLVSQQSVSRGYEVIEVDSYGYSFEEIVAHLKNSGLSLTIEQDVIVTTPDTLPTPVYSSGSVSEQSTQDPNFGSQIRYLGSSEDYVNGLDIVQMWEEINVTTQENPVDVLVLDSSFFESPEVNYTDGRSFTQVPLVTGGPMQERGNDYLPRQESIDEGLCTGHGVGVAGVIAGTMNNGVAGAGITNNVNIHALRVMTCGSGFLSDTTDALRWAAGVEYEGVAPYEGEPGIINISLGATIPSCPSFAQAAINQAIDAGFTIVVAAGNDYEDAANFTPANCDGVTVVAALDQGANKAPFSNVGEEIDFAAAGTNVVAPCNESGSGCYWDGTSFATPIVAGIMAAIKQDTGAQSATLEAALKLTARTEPLGTGCEEGVCGEGVPSAVNALNITRIIQEQGQGSIEFALADKSPCEQTWLSRNFDQSFTLCELYKLSFLGGIELSGISYELLATDMNGSWDDAVQVSIFERSNVYLADLDVVNNQYGFRLCKDGECSGDIFELNADLAQEAYRPAGCQ